MNRTAAFVVVLLFTGLAAYGVAQCPNGSCSRPAVPQPSNPDPQLENGYRWLKRADRPAESYLYLGSKQIGGYNHDEGIYLPLVCGCGLECDCNPCRCKTVWGAPGDPPIPPPFAAQSGHRR